VFEDYHVSPFLPPVLFKLNNLFSISPHHRFSLLMTSFLLLLWIFPVWFTSSLKH